MSTKIEWVRNADGTQGETINPFRAHHRMFRVTRKAAGRLLDGREWDEMPEACA